MTFLSQKELSQLRSDVLATLVSLCRIDRPTTTNTDGYPVEGWGTAVVSIACRLDPLSAAGKGIIAAREGQISNYRHTLPWDADIQDGDRIVMLPEEVKYEMVELHDAHSDRIVKRAIVARIRGE